MDNELDLLSDDASMDEPRPKQHVFTREDGEPIPVHLHRSLGHGGAKALANKIKAAGGDPGVPEENAQVIVCRDDQPIFKQLMFKYEHHRYVWVEPPSWVATCIMRRRYEHVLPGRPIRHSGRMEFTPEDDKHLVEFLALRIPFKEMGGRVGNNVYKDLCNPERAEMYPWAKRHPWQSWRDRYTKNQDIFDPRIAYAVQRDPDPPIPGGKGQYTIKTKAGNLPLRHTVQWSSDMEEEEEEEEEDVMLEPPLNTLHHKRPRPEDPRIHHHHPRQRRHSASPPHKQQRSHEYRQEETGPDSEIDRYEGKRKAAAMVSDLEQFEDDGINNENDAYYAAGPSHASRFNTLPSSPPAHTAVPNSPHGSADLTLVTPKVPAAIALEKQRLEPPHLRKISGSKIAPPPAPLDTVSSNGPRDSQMTLIGPSQPRHPRVTPRDIEVNATVASSSQSHPGAHHHMPPPVQRTAHEVSASEPVYRSTRSRARASESMAKRGRGRQRKVQQHGPPSPNPLSVIREKTQQARPVQDSAQALGMGSHHDETQVELILQPTAADANEDGSSSVAESSDDDPLETRFRDDHKKFVRRSNPQVPSVSKSGHVSTAVGTLPLVALPPSKGGVPSSGVTVLQVSRTNIRGDSPDVPVDAAGDTTPKARPVPRLKAAKKTAGRVSPSDHSESDKTNMRSDAQTDTTESFPTSVPLTRAREYKTSKLEFTPARGTRAEAHVRSVMAAKTNAKGKGKAR